MTAKLENTDGDKEGTLLGTLLYEIQELKEEVKEIRKENKEIKEIFATAKSVVWFIKMTAGAIAALAVAAAWVSNHFTIGIR